MAVYCGVCGERLEGAWENGGSFKVSSKFSNGWLTDEKTGKPVIRETCESCVVTLSDAIAKAATTIANKHRSRIASLKAEVVAGRERQAQQAKERAEFEAEWASRPLHTAKCNSTPGTGCICGAGR
jgi:hypothetical protein